MNNQFNLIKHSLWVIIILAVTLGSVSLVSFRGPAEKEIFAGGNFQMIETYGQIEFEGKNEIPIVGQESSDRFFRPSERNIITTKYTYNNKQHIPKIFNNQRELAEAYFGILSEASNMDGFKGGCGTVGQAKNPYPLVYEMLSKETKKDLNYEQFLQSFKGIGHINLINIEEIETIKEQSKFFAEIETIEGIKDKEGTCFRYYTVELNLVNDKKDGWKIKKITVKPEDFLCYAYHGWWYDASDIAGIEYKIDKILSIRQNGMQTQITGVGKDKKTYDLTFERLTNGADFLVDIKTK